MTVKIVGRQSEAWCENRIGAIEQRTMRRNGKNAQKISSRNFLRFLDRLTSGQLIRELFELLEFCRFRKT